MAELRNEGNASLTNLEATISPDEATLKEGKEDARTQLSQDASSSNKEERKKKQDALKGRENKANQENSEKKESGKNSADKAEAENSGTHSRQSLQSGQTTVQFSSGGNVNMTGSLTSLLGLFASSASLARAESGSALTTSNQASSLTLRGPLQTANNQAGAFLNEDGKNIKTTIGITEERIAESGANKFSLNIGLNQASRNARGDQDSFGNLLKNTNLEATGNANTGEVANKVTVYSTSFPFAYIQTFNAGAFFFNPETIFAFPNSAVTGSILLPNGTTANTFSAFSNIISSYLKAAGLSTSSTYGYQILGPLPTSDIADWRADVPLTSGVTIKPTSTVLTVSLENLPTSITSVTAGLSLTPQGDLFVNVAKPMSVLLDIKIPGNSFVFPIRIDAGPGEVLTTANGNPTLLPNTMVGLTANGQLQNTVFRDTNGYTIVGNGQGLLVNSSGAVSLMGTGATPETFNLPLSGIYAFPSSTIYRHVGTSDSTVPQAATYGNFATYNGAGGTPVANIINLPQAPASYTLTMGGNVLDVYGTKYGIADALTVVLPTTTGTTELTNLPTNTLIMGGNTLAGFGMSYGDLQTLTLKASPSGSASALTQVPSNAALVAPTHIIFNGNALYVDKPVDSTLYPHLQDLNIEVQTSPGQLTQVANINIVFNDSIIQGNAGKNNFYSAIPNIGDLGVSTRYNGFITGVTVSTNSNGQLVTTTAPLALTTNPDGSQVITGNNSITWGNDIYIGGTQDLANPQLVPQNIYHFTLIGDTSNQPVMQGNALITNFNLSTDSLVFQITPALFRALDLNHDKKLTASDLDQAIDRQLIQLELLDLQTLSATAAAYLTATTPTGIPITGTTVSFAGGGTVALNGLDLTTSSTPFESLNTTIEVNLTYVPVSAILPGPSEVFVYGASDTPYFNELDNYFNNSLYATYSVSSNTPLPSGLSIDQYGTISVANTVPFLGSLTIIATDQNNHTATNIPLFGFLDAPVTEVPAGLTGTGSSLTLPNALVGGLGSTLIGSSASAYTLSAIGTAVDSLTSEYSSSLIVDMAGNATGYGTLQNLTFIADGSFHSGTGTAYNAGVIKSSAYTFNPNALAISGTAYGVAESLTIRATGAAGASFRTSGGDASGHFDHNTFNFGYMENQPFTQTLYGNGTLYGDFRQIIIDVAGKSLTSLSAKVTTLTQIDLSASVDHNTFNFSPTSLHVYGDQAGQTTSLYANVADLLITNQSEVSRVVHNLTVNSTATFANNAFVFGNSTLTGGLGTTEFYGHLHTFGDPYNYSAPLIYNGFVKGVDVSTDNGVMTITTNDGHDNSITWGNNTYTGGTALSSKNVYNFTLVQDTTGHAIMQGFDTITNFNPETDTLSFHIATNLFALLGMPNALDIQGLASRLDQDLAVSGSNSFTTLFFEGGGSLILGGYSGITNLAQLAAALPTSIQISSLGTAYTAPRIDEQAIAQFDPVFINSSQPLAFASLIMNTDPLYLTYTATGLPSGMTLSNNIGRRDNGSLTVNVSGPVDAFVTPSFFDGSTTVTLPQPLHIFAINATDNTIHRDETGGTIADAQAFETATAGNTIIGGGAATLSNLSSELLNTPILTYGSKLIYDVSAGGHTAVGNVLNIQFANNGSTSDLNNQTIKFSPNLFKVNASDGGGIWGNAQTVTLSATSTLTEGVPTFGSVSNDQFISGANTLYGSGTLYGNIQTISLQASVQAAGGIDSLTAVTGPVTVSSAIDYNTFTFAPTFLTIEGDQAGSINTLYANVASLSFTKQLSYPTSLPLNVTLSLTPTISNNAFNFGNATLVGGLGTNNFYGHLATFGDPYNFGTTTTPLVYNGFVNGITVTTNNGVMTITDPNHNTITWGNNTYTGGTGPNIYNFTIIKDASGREVMQGFDIITNFNPLTDKLVFNIAANLINKQLSDVSVSNNGADTILSFSGGGSITLKGIVTDLNTLATTNSIQINQQGVSYTPLQINHSAVTQFDSVFINSNLPQTFASFIANNINPLALTWSATGLPSGMTLSADGTLKSVNLAPTPFYGVATINISDSITTVSTPTPIFAIGATDGVIHRDTTSVVRGNMTDAQAFDTKTPGNTIIGGGNDVLFTPGANPTTAAPLIYASKLIYDLSEGAGGHTAIGDIQNLQFINPGTAAGMGLNGQSVIFGPNLFNVNASAGGGVWGNTQTISFTAGGLVSAPTGVVEANINNNTLNFGPNALFGSGAMYGNSQFLTLTASGGVTAIESSTTPIDATIQGNQFTFEGNTIGIEGISASGTLYGNLQSLTFQITDPITSTGNAIGNGFIKDNTFTFGPNTFTSATSGNNLYASIGKLVMANKETSAFTHVPTNGTTTSQITGNTITFSDSTLTATGGLTHFYGDIADLSATAFVSQPVTAITDSSGHVQVTDSFGNTITWGNNTFTGTPNANLISNDTYTFTLLTPEGNSNSAVMQGNATIYNFTNDTFEQSFNTLAFNITSTLWQSISSQSGEYNRTLSGHAFSQFFPSQQSYDSQNSEYITTLNFTQGSITLRDVYSGYLENNINVNLAYDPVPVTIKNTNPAPLLLSGTTNFGGISYGNVLDQYFNNIDLGNTASTYAITDAYSGLGGSSTPFSLSNFSNLTFDQYGTARIPRESIVLLKPGFSYVTVTPNDAHFSSNILHLNLVIGLSDGTRIAEPVTGNYIGNQALYSVLQSHRADETMIGSQQTLTVAPISLGSTFSNEFGLNMLINTNSGTVAYGAFQDINFNLVSQQVSSSTVGITNSTYTFYPNFFDVKGTVYGIADTFTVNLNNILTTTDAQNSAVFDKNILYFGANGNSTATANGQQVNVSGIVSQILGEGTIYGDLNSFQINLTGAEAAPGATGIDTFKTTTTFTDNHFIFGGKQISILGDSPSTIYTNVNSFSFSQQQGLEPQGTSTSTMAFSGNTFTFENSIVVAGNGGTDIYPNINDLSGTTFWNSALTLTLDSSGNTISVKDANANTLTWGNDTLYLGNGTDTIHLNLLEGALTAVNSSIIYDFPVMQGNLKVYNFNPQVDYIEFKLSEALYTDITGNGGGLSATSLGAFQIANQTSSIVFNDTGTDTTIRFLDANGQATLGSITLYGVTGYATLADFGSHIRVGTTFVGKETSDSFTFIVPSNVNNDFSAFQEFDHITQFDPALDNIHITLSASLYNGFTLSGYAQDALINALKASATTATGGITVTETSAQYTSGNGVTVDSNLQFITNGQLTGEITLHNVDLTNPSTQLPDLAQLGSQLQIGAQGIAGASDTFYFYVSPDANNDFSSFTSATYITNLDTSLNAALTEPVTTLDHVQVMMTRALYEAVSQNGTLIGEDLLDALADSAQTAIGGLTVSPNSAGTGTKLNFVTNGTVTGFIDLHNVQAAGLVDLNPVLQFGFLEQGTTSEDTFTFTVPAGTGNTFGSFQQFNHVTQFDLAHDNFNLTLPVALYNAITQNGLSGYSLESVISALGISASTARGGVTVAANPAQYVSSNGVAVDSTLKFTTNSQVMGEITLHNVDLTNSTTHLPDLNQLGSHFQIGAQGTNGVSETFYFNVPSNTNNNFTSFQNVTYISNFNPAEDTIQVSVSAALYNKLSSYALLSETTVGNILNASAGTSIGGITFTPDAAGTGTNLNFITNGAITGSIDFQGVNISNLSSLGSHFDLGIQGTANVADTYTFYVPSTATPSQSINYTIKNFGSGDALQILLPVSFYERVSQNYTYHSFNNSLENAIRNSAFAGTGGIKVTSDGAGGTLITGFAADGTEASTIHVLSTSLTIYDLQYGFVDQGTAGTTAPSGDIFNFMVPDYSGNNTSTFTQFDHIINFNTGSASAFTDTLQITLPLNVYNAISQNQTLTGSQLAQALQNSASTSTGGVVMTEVSNGYGGENTILSFVTTPFTGATPQTSGSITLENTDIHTSGSGSPSLVDFGSMLQIGYFQQGTTGTDTFNFSITGNDYSSFQKFGHIIDFTLTQDNLQIILPLDVYNAISNNQTLTGYQLAQALQNSASTPTGGVVVTEVSNGHGGENTILSFVTTSGTTSQTSSSITLENTDIPTSGSGSPSLVDFGSRLQIGYFEKGTNGNPDTFNFSITGNDYSSFQKFAHILDFTSTQDNLQLTLSQDLYKALSSDGKLTGTVSAASLQAGTNGTSIHVVQVSAEYSPANGGSATGDANVDSIIQFLNNNQLSGAVTLHNVAITDLSQLPHLVVAHA